MNKLKLAVVALFVFTSINSFAQNKPTTGGSDLYKGWSAQLNLGVTQPYTDLNEYQYFKTFKSKNENRPAISIGARKMFSSVMGLQSDVAFGSILGNARILSNDITGLSEREIYTKNIYNFCTFFTKGYIC